MRLSIGFLSLFFVLFFNNPAIGQSADKLPAVKQTSFKSDTFNITDYGAERGGMVLNTQAINAAITACHENGGGVVLIPEGIWLSGPIKLKSNVNLHLQKNSLLEFTKDFDQYKLVSTHWEGIPQMRNQSPVSAFHQTNIAITGDGIIDGNGDAWRMVKKSKMTSSQWKNLLASGGVLSDDKKVWYPSEKSLKGAAYKDPGYINGEKDNAFFESVKDYLRPNMIVFSNCNTVLLEGVTFQNSAAWNIHPLMCENVTVRNIFVKNPWYSQNGDGIDIESCKNVLVIDSKFDVGDDALCIKSGRDEEGRKRGIPSENILIKNCTVYHAHGGFVIGSEMSGGAKNIYVEDCSFIGTDIGLRFKTTRGRGGIVENIFIKNIYMKDIPGETILFDMYYAAVDPIPLDGEERQAPKVVMMPVSEETPQFRNFYVENVACDGADKAVFIRGLPEMNIRNINLKNITVRSEKGIDVSEAQGIHFTNVKVVTNHSNPVVDILNSSRVSFNHLSVNDDAALVFRIGGERSKKISVKKSDFSAAGKLTEFEFGAGPGSFKKK